MKTTTKKDTPREAGQKIISEILESCPCPQCGAVEVLLCGAGVPGATCDCGRKEGTQVRWEIWDIWDEMSTEQQASVYKAEADIDNEPITVT